MTPDAAPSDNDMAPATDAQHQKGTRRVALVTGGAIRVGRATALALAQAGLDVAITYRGSEAEARQTVKDIQATGAHATLIHADLQDPTTAAMLPARVAEAMTRLDVLVNNASIFERTPVGGVDPTEWDDLFAINAKAPFFLSQAAVPYLKYEDPSIVNIIDVSAGRPWPAYIPYCASKAALEAVTVGLAKALAPKVRVNGVAPGPVLAPDDYDETEHERASQATLLKRWGRPEDVAQAVVYLATAAPFTTGAIIPVDGGRRVA